MPDKWRLALGRKPRMLLSDTALLGGHSKTLRDEGLWKNVVPDIPADGFLLVLVGAQKLLVK